MLSESYKKFLAEYTREEYTKEFVQRFIEEPICDHPNPFFCRMIANEENKWCNFSKVEFNKDIWSGLEAYLDIDLAISLFKQAGFYEAVDIPTAC